MRKMCLTVLLFSHANGYYHNYMCEYGWEYVGSHCYKYFFNFISWGQAEKQCNSYGARLGATHSDSEQYELNQLNGNMGFTVDTWLGGYFDNATSDPQWRWSDNKAIGYFYNDPDWKTWNTDNYPGECLAMQPGSGYWIDRNCTDELQFVCAKSTDFMGNVYLWWEILLYCCAGLLFLGLVCLAACFCMGTVACCIDCSNGACGCGGCCCCKKKNNRTAPTEIPVDNLNSKMYI